MPRYTEDEEMSFGQWNGPYTKKSRMAEYADSYVEIIVNSPIYLRAKENEERLAQELEEKAAMVRFLMAENEKLRRKYKQSKKQKHRYENTEVESKYVPIYPEPQSCEEMPQPTEDLYSNSGETEVAEPVPEVVIKQEPVVPIRADYDEEVVIVDEPISYDVVEIEEVAEKVAEEETEETAEEETKETAEEETEEEVAEETEEEGAEEETEEETAEEETEEVVEETEETAEEETEEEGVYEISVNGKRYYTTNETNGTIYELLEDDDVGEEIGRFVNKQIVWNA